MRRTVDVVLVALVLFGAGMTACGRGDGGSASATTVPTTLSESVLNVRFPDDQVVWQTELMGGLVSQVAWAARRPSITIFGDGRVFVQQPGLDPRYDQPIPLRTGTVDRRDLAAFIGRAEASGLFDPDVGFGTPDIPDVSATAITLHGSTGPHRVEVEGLGGRFDAEVTEKEAERRDELRLLLSDAEALVPDAEPVRPARIRVLVLPDNASFEPSPDDIPEDEIPSWPGPALGTFDQAPPAITGSATIVGCGELTGDVARDLFDEAVENPTPHWTVAGKQKTVLVVALLPGETACG